MEFGRLEIEGSNEEIVASVEREGDEKEGSGMEEDALNEDEEA